MNSPVAPNTATATQAPKPVLLPYQQAWIADRSKLKVGEKSRRIGLTWAEAADNVLIGSRESRPQNVYYIGYNQDMAVEYIEAAAMWARAFDRAASEVDEGLWDEKDVDGDKSIKSYTIKFPNGKRIVALSSRPANLRGKQGVVVIDEAAFHEQLGQLLKAALALLIWGGQVRVLSTHFGDDNPFNELINDIRAGRKRGEVHRTEFQEAVQHGLYRRVCERLGEDWTQEGEDEWVQEVYAFYGEDATEELDVVPSQSGGRYIARVVAEAAMWNAPPVVRLEKTPEFTLQPEHVRIADIRDWCEAELKPLLERLPSDRQHVLGEDFARSGDLTVLAPLTVELQLTRRSPFVVELRNVPFEAQKQILFYILDRLPRFGGAALDARGNGQYLAEVAMQRYGPRIEQVMLTESWYREHMPPFKAALEDQRLFPVKDAEILEDLLAFQTINGVPRLPKAPTQGGRGARRHGDAGIAYALAWYASENMTGEFDITPLNASEIADLGFGDLGFGGGRDLTGFM